MRRTGGSRTRNSTAQGRSYFIFLTSIFLWKEYCFGLVFAGFFNFPNLFAYMRQLWMENFPDTIFENCKFSKAVSLNSIFPNDVLPGWTFYSAATFLYFVGAASFIASCSYSFKQGIFLNVLCLQASKIYYCWQLFLLQFLANVPVFSVFLFF